MMQQYKIPPVVSLFLMSLLCVLPATGQVETKLIPQDGGYLDQFGADVAISNGRAVIGAFRQGGNGNGPGAAYIFEAQPNNNWIETNKLTTSDLTNTYGFGYSVDIHEDRIIIGAPLWDGEYENIGAVYIFERQVTGEWLEMVRLTPSDGEESDAFGTKVALYGDVALVNSRDDDKGTGAGAVYVFERRKNGTWYEHSKLTANNGAPEDRFGEDVSLHGKYAFIGAPGKDNIDAGDGVAYVFKQNLKGEWLEIAMLYPENSIEDEAFGESVSISGGRGLVGARNADINGKIHSGKAYVFEEQLDGRWEQVAEIINRDVRENARFGSLVALDGDEAIIHAGNQEMHPPKFEPSVFYYKRGSNGRWQIVRHLLASDYDSDSGFGAQLAIDKGVALIGDPNDDDQGLSSGSAYIYQLYSGGSQTAVKTSDVLKLNAQLDSPAGILELKPNYPNPFISETVFEFSVPRESYVRLTVYDLLGREARRLVDEVVDAGTQHVYFYTHDLPGGVYIYKLETIFGMRSGKMLLVK